MHLQTICTRHIFGCKYLLSMSKWKAALKRPSAGNRLLEVVIGVINHPYFLVHPSLLLSPVGSGGDIIMSAGRQDTL